MSENEVKTGIFENPIYPDLAAFNGQLKDLTEIFDKTTTELAWIEREAESRDKFPLNKIDNNGLTEWGVIDGIGTLLSNCENLLPLVGPLFEKAVDLPIRYSIYEVGEIIKNIVSNYKVDVEINLDGEKTNYGYLFQCLYRYYNCLISQKDRLISTSKVINSFIENGVSLACQSPVNTGEVAKEEMPTIKAESPEHYLLLDMYKNKGIRRKRASIVSSSGVSDSTLKNKLLPDFENKGLIDRPPQKPRSGYGITEKGCRLKEKLFP